MHALFPQPMHAYTYTGIASIKKPQNMQLCITRNIQFNVHIY